MNRARTLVFLVIGIVLLIVAHFAIDVRTDSAPRELRRNVLVPSAARADTLSVQRHGETVTRLVREDAWKIVAPYGASAEHAAVLRLTDALAYIPVAEEMTDAELLRIGRTRRDFGLDEPRLVVTVGNGASGAETSVRFGSSTPAGDGVYATVGERDVVCLVPSNVFAAVNLDASGFRRRRVLVAAREDVASFDIRNGPGHFVRLDRTDRAWKVSEPKEGAASSERVGAFLDALVQLEACDFVWPVGATNETPVLSDALLSGYGLLSDSSLAITLKCADAKGRTISFGREAGDGRVYALTPDGTIVTVPAAARDEAVASMDAFVETRLFPADVAETRAISLDDGGVTYLLSRTAEGAWRLDAPVSAEADPKAIENLLTRLRALKLSDAGTEGVQVSMGTNTAPVSVPRAAIFHDARPEDLRSKTILRVDPKAVVRVVITDNGQKPVAAVADVERKKWGIERADAAMVLDGEAVQRIVDALSPLDAVSVVRLKISDGELGVYGLDKPLRTLAVDQSAEGSVRRNILIGNVTDGGRYATLGASDAVFVISSACADVLLAPIMK